MAEPIENGPQPQEDEDPLLYSMRQEVHLLRNELAGLREMLESVTGALKGAQKAYAAVAQRADLLEARMTRIKGPKV